MLKKSCTISMFFLIFALAPVLCFSATLHSIIIGDTQDGSIGKSVKIDIPKMSDQAKKISIYTGLDLKETQIVGSKVSVNNILSTLESLSIAEDDTVILYYSGHGYRTDNPKDNIWPNISPPGWRGVNLEYLTEILINKNPRFILAIADVCNNTINELFAPETLIRRGIVNENTIKANCIKLFVESKGIIIASGSSPSQYAWCDQKNGGHFTFYYLQFLNEELRKIGNTADWENIFSNAKSKLIKQQKPQYQIIWVN